MRIVKVLGGLGNQMFQFALYEALRRQYPAERVLLDLHCFRGYGRHRGFELPQDFAVGYETATLGEVARLAWPYPCYQAWRIGSRVLPGRGTMLCEQPDMRMEPTALSRQGDTYYDGYWQHEDYFAHIREALLGIFRFPEFADARSLQAVERIDASNACAVHIRRGDYLTDPLRRGTVGTDYAERAIRKMMETEAPDCWCVFSDDMAWTRAALGRLLPDSRSIYVDWNQGARSIDDMHLMTRCRHHIIANSSFSWWGAWLCTRHGKTVIAPRQWMNLSGASSPVPDRWTQI